MNAGFSETHLIVIFTNSLQTSLSHSAFSKKSLFFFSSPLSPMFLHVVISLRLPMVFNSSFVPGAFYKLYSHGLLAWPPTAPACLNSICLHPRHIQWVKNGPSPAGFFCFFFPLSALLQSQGGSWEGDSGYTSAWGAPLAPLSCVWWTLQDLHPSTLVLVLPNLSIARRCIISDGSLFKLNPKCIT